MRVAVVLCLLAAAVTAVKISEEVYQSAFTEFVAEFDKQYSASEFFQRFAVFKTNYAHIVRHNTGNHTWSMGVNQFSDLTAEEFEAIYLSGLLAADFEPMPSSQEYIDAAGDKDWRTEGAVTAVKNQAQCGSCWAFSTTGTVEGSHFLKTKKLLSLSEQQLVDCSGSTGNQGCNGGWPKWALTYIEKNGGFCDQAGYPYTGRDGTCKTTCQKVVQVAAHKELNSEAQLVPAIELAPISIAITASSAFQSYKTGVFTGACPGQVNHAVLLTGYGTEGSTDYWWIKNSWGASWGDKGYIRFPRGQNKCSMGYASVHATA